MLYLNYILENYVRTKLNTYVFLCIDFSNIFKIKRFAELVL